MNKITFKGAFKRMPLIAIIRGVQPFEVAEIAIALQSSGFAIIEVSLNSPNPYDSIKIMDDLMGDKVLIGAGTVLNIEQVELVKQAGGRLIVSPNTNSEVITHTKRLGMCSLPGFYTPTDAFKAIEAGADGLKMFPADTLGPTGFKAVSAVLPKNIPIFPVGGVNQNNMGEYIQLGVSGFGIGSSIYKAGMKATEVKEKASSLIQQYNSIISKD